MERVYTTPLLDKLGIRPGMRVALIDIDDEDIRPLIAERTTDITEGWPEPDTDVVLLGADSHGAARRRSPTWPPGSGRTARSGSCRARARPRPCATSRSSTAAKAAGLVDNKVASFSPTHTALRLVIPVAHRRSALTRADCTIRRMPDLLLILIVILVVVVVLARPEDPAEAGRGARPGRQGGEGRGVKAQAEIQARVDGETDPARPSGTTPDRPA